MYGGGNIGTQFACICTSKSYRLNIFSSKPEKYDGILEVIDENNRVTVGNIGTVTANIGEAIKGYKIIFVIHLAFQFKKLSEAILLYVEQGTNICVLPGTGGVEFAFRKCIKAGAILSGFQRVPTVAQFEKYGKHVQCEGLHDKIFLVSIQGRNSIKLFNFIASLFQVPYNAMSFS